MGLVDELRMRIINWLGVGAYSNPERVKTLVQRELGLAYYQGNQKQTLKVKPMQADDNLTVNLAGPTIRRSINLMLGDRVDFDLPGEPEDEAQQYIDMVWDANRRMILLIKACQYSSIIGTGYLKILPDGMGDNMPRIVPLDSRWMFIHTRPDDMETVTAYEMEYAIDVDGEKVHYREVTRWDASDEMGQPASWAVDYYESSNATGGRWVLERTVEWGYPFPPIVHWQNLPIAWSVYGESDVPPDAVQLQDAVNFNHSNMQKILRLHAHPQRWGKMLGQAQNMSWGPDEMPAYNNPEAEINTIEMQSDLSAAMNATQELKRQFYSETSTVDLGMLHDKIGQITNFGLQVIYQDAIAKRNIKRGLMEEALNEINRRLLVIGGYDDDPGVTVWPETMPRDMTEELNALAVELANGLVSKRTASGELGRDWELEEERMSDEQAASGNIGSFLLNQFNAGG